MRRFFKLKGFSIRLLRQGCANRPFYQIGIVPTSRRPGLPPDEIIGSYDPMPNEKGETIASVDLNRLAYWLGRDAYLSFGVSNVLGMFLIYSS